MESLSPLVKNTSVRRLSLELVQKFATNLLSSPVANNVNHAVRSSGRRRASDACFESPSSQKASTSPISPFSHHFNSNLNGRSCISPQKPQLPPTSPFLQWQQESAESTTSDEDCFTENKRPRKSSMVTCNVIPPTPIKPRRRSSFSFSPHHCALISPHRQSPNKENEIPQRRLSSSCLSPSDDFIVLAMKHYGLGLRPQEVLGKGSFGTVVAASYNGSEVAVKVLRQTKSEEHLRGELNGFRLPPHPHIVSVLDVLRIPPNRALVLLERMESGNLLSLINDSFSSSSSSTFPLLGLSSIMDISCQIASALTFCHSHGVLHLDVKPQNILFQNIPTSVIKGDYKLTVKLSDFGNSRNISDIQRTKSFNKLDGTVGYKAPELFRGEKPTEKCDVYSLGVTMWQLLTREQPYLGETEHSVIYKVVAQGLRPKAVCNFHQQQKQDIRERKFIEMYEMAWNADPEQRQSMIQLYQQLSQLRTQFNEQNTTNFFQQISASRP